jgi:hypothetical protein
VERVFVIVGVDTFSSSRLVMKGDVMRRSYPRIIAVFLFIASLLFAASFCLAGVRWTANGVELRGTGVTGESDYPQITSDGSGGAIVTWQDGRSGSQADIYAQRVDVNGSPQWTANGVELRGTGVTGNAWSPQITTDGSGGAIVTWQDLRLFPWKIYAQRVDSSGTPRWTANGVEIRGAGVPSAAHSPQITSDGSGGAIVTWLDYRSGSQGEVYAQRVDTNGNPMWTANGVQLRGTGVANDANFPQITSDGSGGAIVTWEDRRDGEWDIYVQRVDSSGVPQWTANGVELRGTGVTDDASYPEITTDGSGGAIVTWRDRRTSPWSIYAQEVDSSGTPQWTANGVDLRGTGVSGNAASPQITSDGSGGAIVIWRDFRSGSHWDIYARRVDSSGAPQWTTNGVEIRGGAAVTGNSYAPQITTDGLGGAIVCWDDYRSGTQRDIYAQRVDSAGTPQWTVNGVELRGGAAVTSHAYASQLTIDGSGGAIVTWEDLRSGQRDIYAQRISNDPPTMTGITPDAGFNSEVINISDLAGTGFLAPDYSAGPINPIVKLKMAGETDINASNVNVASPTQITCSFDLTGVSAGAWDVYVENPDGQAATLAGAFSVEQATGGFYFAEGCTGPGFQEFLSLANPGGEQAFATITYMFSDGTDQVQQLVVPPQSRATVDVNAVVGPDKEVSANVRSNKPIVAERPIYFSYQGAWSGGHVVVGAEAPSNTWYFAEGYTGPGFEEYVCVLNPGDTQANLTFSFQTQEEGEKVVGDLYVPPNARLTFSVNVLLGGSYQNSLMLTSTQPVVAERPMYFDYSGTTGDRGWHGGHCVMGAPSLSTEYYFSEGTTRDGFETWLTIQNPHVQPITVDATYQLGDGQGVNVNRSYDVGPGTRYTVLLEDEVGAGKDVSAHLTSTNSFLAERPTYFSYQGAWPGGHCVIGATSPATEWLFAEGYTGDSNPFSTWLCLQNPGTENAQVQLTYYPQDGGTLPPQDLTVPAGTRVSLLLNDQVGGDHQLSFGVTSDKPIVAERPMYFDYNGMTGGHDDLGFTP